ncbi:MAG: thioesterase family protein [Chloroflexota bacterium]
MNSDKPIEALLKPFPVITEIKVQWGEMDAARHVNNAVYLRWAETARVQFFHELKVFSSPQSKAGMILGWQDCKYIFPVTFPDTVLIGSRARVIEQERIMVECHFFSTRHQRLVAISNHRQVAYDYTALTKIPLPAEWKERIFEIQGLEVA